MADDSVGDTSDVEADTEPTPSGPAPSATQPEPTADAAADPTSLEASPCGFDAILPLPREPECFRLTVPEDWDAPDSGATVTIPIARFAASEGAVDPDPVVYLEGGPGGHALDALPYQYAVLVEPLNSTRDFIVYDQRGAGLSEPSLACPEVDDASLAGMETADDRAVEEAAELQGVEACRDRLLADGVDLTEYHSINSANDLDALRSHLGYEQLNLLGISYGTRLAQTYARLYPDSIRSVVLDSVDPVEGELFSATTTNAQRSMRRLFDACQDDPSCAERYPNLEARYFALVAQLDAEPEPIQAIHPLRSRMYNTVVTGADLLGLTFSALYNQSFFGLIPKLVDDAETGEFNLVGALVSQALVQPDLSSTGMYLSVQCHEDIPFDDRSRLAAYEPVSDSYTQLAEAVSGEALFDACDLWPADTAAAVEDEVVISDAPTLLLAGAYDPITPPSTFDEVTPGLSTYWEFVFPHEGHGISPTPCGAQIVNAFLADPRSEPDGSCIAETSPPPFTPVPLGGIELVEFETSLFGSTIRSVRPADWIEQGPGAFVRGATAVDPTLLVAQGTGGAPPAMLLGLLESTFGDMLGEEITLEATDPTVVDGVAWETFDAELPGQRLRATASDEALVVIAASTEEFDELVERVLLPALQAVEVS